MWFSQATVYQSTTLFLSRTPSCSRVHHASVRQFLPTEREFLRCVRQFLRLRGPNEFTVRSFSSLAGRNTWKNCRIYLSGRVFGNVFASTASGTAERTQGTAERSPRSAVLTLKYSSRLKELPNNLLKNVDEKKNRPNAPKELPTNLFVRAIILQKMAKLQLNLAKYIT